MKRMGFGCELSHSEGRQVGEWVWIVVFVVAAKVGEKELGEPGMKLAVIAIVAAENMPAV